MVKELLQRPGAWSLRCNGVVDGGILLDVVAKRVRVCRLISTCLYIYIHMRHDTCAWSLVPPGQLLW